MEKYDVYLANVSYIDSENNINYKIRPVMILDNNTVIPLANPITSHVPRLYMNGDYWIQDWQEAGLTRPSTLRLNYIVDDSNGELLRKIGHISDEDIANIELLYPQVNPKDLK